MSAQPAYGGLGRLLHRIAFDRRFGGMAIQKSLAEIDGGLLDRRNGAAGAGRAPVFVTALPRAGTTLLLNLLARVPEFATHTYRDMPFVLAPQLWGRLSGRFRKAAQESERAHGDGVMVGYDSPEAFEEVLWMTFWRDRYRTDRILPWAATDRDAEFEAFFSRHMRAVIAARAAERPGREPARYLSKNNANIARLALLPAIFPDCRIVVPLREPRSHCRSLLRQHLRFLKMHAGDPFSRRYMGWIGHFEFGANLRPIEFPAAHGGAPTGDPQCIDFWFDYWIRAQSAILAADDAAIRLDYAALCADPRGSLRALARALSIADPDALVAGADTVRSPPGSDADDETGDPVLLRRAEELYAKALECCINRSTNCGDRL